MGLSMKVSSFLQEEKALIKITNSIIFVFIINLINVELLQMYIKKIKLQYIDEKKDKNVA